MRHGVISRGIASVATLVVVSTLGWVALVAPAQADTAPATGTPATVSADALATWQVNGVVWSQDTVGNNVWAGGKFTAARPPGVAAGGAGEVSANNLFVYDVTTGNRVASISHSLNGQVLAVKKSPDGSRVYVGGDFTTVDGQVRNHVAAFDASSGALIAGFAPSVDASVSALAVSGTTVYAGGAFTHVGSAVRTRLAAFSPTTGAVTSWAPAADMKVAAMVMSPDGSRVIVGGSFGTLNGVAASGMGALDVTTGATLAWAANTKIKDSGSSQCGITSLRTDGTQVYGAGFAYGCGNFEGTFAADPATGAINWVNDCQGDTYDVLPVGQVLYSVTHAHNCSMIGAFPESNPRSTNQRHALAYTTYPTGTNGGPDVYGWNYNGVPDATMLQWFPNFTTGTYTGQSQAAWSVTGTSSYVALGGEFPTVNGTAQQGLVRFAVKSIAPNKRGPARGTAPDPTANSLASGTVRVAWQAAYDMDNATLTYDVYRSGTTAPVYTTTQDSTFWNYPMMGFIDKGVTPGQSYTYTIKATDPLGNVNNFPKTNSATVGTAAASAYSKDVLNDGATDYWRLGEASGSAVLDYSGFNDATAGTGVSRGSAGAVTGDTDAASSFDGTGNGVVTQNSSQAATKDLSVEAWVKTTSTSGGKIVGYGNSNSTTGGTSSGYDRHIYMDNAGHLIFGIYDGNTRVIQSTGTYNDGAYHQVVGTLSSTKGMTLFVDGKKVGTNASGTVAQDYTGFWRIGGDNLGGWPNQPSSNFLAGTIDDVAIYPTTLALTQVQQHYVDSGRQLSIAPKPTDAYGKAVYASQPDLYWRLGESGGATAKDTSPNGTDGTFYGNPSFGQPSGVNGTSDTSVGFDGNSTGVASSTAVNNPTTYSEELWFKTTTTNGGKLIGFGSSNTSSTSNHYDRHVWMETNGKLTFGVYTGQLVTISTPASYNDGTWHQVVATQGSGGMALYVDGKSVGTDPNTAAENYTGYWRVGGDSSWTTQPWFAGTIDEVSVYSSVLSPADVTAHYTAGTPAAPNQAPTASFTSSTSNLTASLDASTSFDPDGSIASYSWDFGDGSAAGSGVSPQHPYAAAGTYAVKLTVTDDKGATGSVTQSVTVTAPVNQAPTASFTSSTSNLTASLDASTSFDPDGSIASYSWDFGDGSAAGSGVSPQHSYAAPGTYAVKLTVNDDKGASSSSTQNVTVTAPVNQAPTASFTSSTSDLSAAFDGSGSSDADGTVASYSWDFGDGSAAGSGAKPSHTYAAAGTYAVKLTVSDDKAATGSVTKSVTVTAPPVNQAPSAAFTSTVSGLSAAFDGSGSSDADGTVASYSWDFGDGSAVGSGAKPSHTFAAAGTYAVKLTVTDDKAATGSLTKSVTVTAPPAGPVLRASDDFGRSVTGGWGTSDQGGAWTIASSKTSFGVSGGVGSMSLGAASASRVATLGDVSVRNTDVTVSVTPDKIGTGAGTYVAAYARQSSSGSYRAQAVLKADGTVTLQLQRADGTGATTVIAAAKTVSGLTYAAGTPLNLRLQTVGTSPTTVQARVWKAGTTEPTSWQVSATDSTSGLQTAGAVAVYGYLSGSSTNAPVALTWDALRVYDLGQ